MTQFNPTNRMPRPRFTTTLPSGPSVGLQAAGIEDPVVGRDPAGEQLQGALNEFTQTVGIAASIATRNENDRDRAEARAERDAYRAQQRQINADNLQWGAISRTISTDVRERLPGDIDAIGKGTFGWIPADEGDPEKRMHRLAEEATIDVPEAFRDRAIDQFKAQWATRGLNAMYAKSKADQKQAKDTAIEGTTNTVMLLADPAKIGETMAEAKRTIPGFTDDDADEVVVSAMLNTAKLGTPESAAMVEGFKGYLGKREVAARDQADRIVEAGKQKAESERNKQFANEAAIIRDRAFDRQTPPEKVKAEIKASAKALGIEERFVEDQIATVNTAIRHRQDEEIKRQVYESVANEVAARNFVSVNATLSSVGDATTPPTGLVQKIDFQPIPGLPEELGGVKVQRARFIEETRRQTGVELENLDTTDGVNVTRWTRYVRAMAGSGIEDEQQRNALLSLDFNTTDKGAAQTASPQNARAAQRYLLIKSINSNYAASLVASDPRAKKFYDSVAIDMLTPGAKLTPQIINTAVAKGQVKPEDESKPGDKAYAEVLKAAPNLSPSMVQYAVRTYNEQKGKAGALEYAVQEAQGRGVQLWQSWAGWANWAVPFTRANDSPSRPLVDLGTLATEDASVRPAIGTAMESLLEERAKEINKLDPTLKTQATDLSLNYIGNGVWEVEGIKAGGLDDKYDNLFFVTDAQVRERVGKNADTAKVEPLADLEKQLEQARKYRAEIENYVKTGVLPNIKGAMSMGGMSDGKAELQAIETKIKVRRLQESKKNP